MKAGQIKYKFTRNKERGKWQWRWKSTKANNQVVGTSHEAFHNFKDAVSNAADNGYIDPHLPGQLTVIVDHKNVGVDTEDGSVPDLPEHETEELEN